jgi:hypothetical protein
MTSTSPETRAALLLVAVFASTFRDNPRMTIGLHTSSGSTLRIAGELDDRRMHFHPAEVSTFLDWLTHAVAYDPTAVLTVTTDIGTPTSPPACGPAGWAVTGTCSRRPSRRYWTAPRTG